MIDLSHLARHGAAKFPIWPYVLHRDATYLMKKAALSRRGLFVGQAGLQVVLNFLRAALDDLTCVLDVPAEALDNFAGGKAKEGHEGVR